MEDCTYCGQSLGTDGHGPASTLGGGGIPVASCPQIPDGWIVDPGLMKRAYLWGLAVLLENRRLQLKYSATASES